VWTTLNLSGFYNVFFSIRLWNVRLSLNIWNAKSMYSGHVNGLNHAEWLRRTLNHNMSGNMSLCRKFGVIRDIVITKYHKDCGSCEIIDRTWRRHKLSRERLAMVSCLHLPLFGKRSLQALLPERGHPLTPTIGLALGLPMHIDCDLEGGPPPGRSVEDDPEDGSDAKGVHGKDGQFDDFIVQLSHQVQLMHRLHHQVSGQVHRPDHSGL
jgi:hypothetical protein